MGIKRLMTGLVAATAATLAMTGLFAAPANAASQSFWQNVTHGRSSSVSFNVGSVCGWGASAIQVSVQGDWNTGSLHVYNTTVFNNVTTAIYTYGTTAYVYNGGSWSDGRILSSSGGVNIYGGGWGSDNPNRTVKGPFITVYVDIAKGGGIDCGEAAVRVQVV